MTLGFSIFNDVMIQFCDYFPRGFTSSGTPVRHLELGSWIGVKSIRPMANARLSRKLKLFFSINQQSPNHQSFRDRMVAAAALPYVLLDSFVVRIAPIPHHWNRNLVMFILLCLFLCGAWVCCCLCLLFRPILLCIFPIRLPFLPFQSVTKLASLLVKTLAKPLSKRIKHEFSRYEVTQRFLISIGQATHQITSRMTIWSAGYKVRSIKPLEEEKALSTGAEFVGETFVLLVSGGTVVWEYNRSKAKEIQSAEEKRQVATNERRALQAKLHALDVRVQALENAALATERQRQLEATASGGLSTLLLGGSNSGVISPTYRAPDPKEIVPIDADVDEVIACQQAKENNSATAASDSENAEPEGTNATDESSAVNRIEGSTNGTATTKIQTFTPSIVTEAVSATSSPVGWKNLWGWAPW